MDVIRRLLLSVALLAALPALAQEKFIVVASTTSTEQSGLFGYLLPVFQKKTGIQVRVVALGMPDVRLVILPSPLAPRSVAEVQRLAHAYAPEIIGLLSHS